MFLKESNYSFWFVLRLLRKDLLWLSGVIIVVSVTNNFLMQNQTISISVPALMGTALSLILAFRTGQAYDRWWEARKIWGEIINDSRSLIRASMSFVKEPAEPAGKSLIESLVKRQVAWCYALGSTLRKQDAFIHASDFLSREERERVSEFKNIPNALLREHSMTLHDARHANIINDFGLQRLDEIVMRLTDCMGKCERIKNTVFPTPYTRIVHFIIYVFSISLIFGIDDPYGLIEIPVTIILTIVFLSLERIAIILQDPFENNPSDIPVTAIARNIEIDLKQMIGEEDLPRPIMPQRNYLL